ncbi:MAG TPA: sugar phosphate nucleotidyltransferase, partial [Limnochordia bacterium]|nr:sugar phosphate nucleotidyltransferase [Limnochordia bacterium]
ATMLKLRHGDDDPVVAALTADHAIADEARFREILAAGEAVASSGPHIVVIGIPPTRPETGFGYLRTQSDDVVTAGGVRLQRVEAFVEKPDPARARAFLEAGNYRWNSGMFVFRLSTLLDLIRQHMPPLHEALQQIEAAWGAPDFAARVHDAFEPLPKISIDKGVMEKAPSIYALPGDIGWDDVGAWAAVERIQTPDADGNVIDGEALGCEVRDSILVSEGHAVVAFGVEDLTVVAQPDVTFVAPKKRTPEIKHLVARLKQDAPHLLARPDENAIRFGTDGWRGVIGEAFTFENVARVARGVGRYLRHAAQAEPQVVIGFDRRFQSRAFAQRAAEVLAGLGVRVTLADQPVTSPALSLAVVERSAALGLMVTASHNPPQWNGIKVKAGYGGSAGPELVEQIQTWCNVAHHDAPAEVVPVQTADLRAAHLARVRALTNLKRLPDSLRIVVDPMHGSGAGTLAALLREFGATVIEIRSEENPGFGGVNPEPIEPNLEALRQAIKEHDADLGLALDGDGDRVGAMQADGRFVNPHEIFALLLQHLVERREQRGVVVKTFSTTQMIDKLCAKYNLPLREVPIGFKYVADVMQNEDVLIGGEESGGIGFRGYLPERDGVVSALLLVEAIQASGSSLAELVAALHHAVGPHHYGRIDLHLPQADKEAAVGLLRRNAPAGAPPRSLAGLGYAQMQDLDGYKFLDRSGWLLIRPSGTEPVLRLYAEASSDEQVRAALRACEGFVREAAAGRD